MAATPLNNTTIAAALQALANTINSPPPTAPAIPATEGPLLDPFTDDQPFDLSTHARAAAFATAKKYFVKPTL